MAKGITTGVLVRSDEVAWATLQQIKAGIECVAEGSDESSLEEIKTPVVMALPSADVLLRVMKFPLVDDDELEGMVELQVDKFSPFPFSKFQLFSFSAFQHFSISPQTLSAGLVCPSLA